MMRIKTLLGALLLVSAIGIVNQSAHAATSIPQPIAGNYSLLTDDAVGGGYAVELGNLLFYIGNDSKHGVELWRTDGTASGTKLVVDATPGRDSTNFLNLFVAGGKVWFSSWGGGIWATTGTAASTKKISNTLILDDAVDHPTQPNMALKFG